MLGRYRQTPIEEGDKRILQKSPFVKMWEAVKPYLLQLNSSYSKDSLSHIVQQGRTITTGIEQNSLGGKPYQARETPSCA